jgi:hypothetical protein
MIAEERPELSLEGQIAEADHQLSGHVIVFICSIRASRVRPSA